jgi:hypothetical protein
MMEVPGKGETIIAGVFLRLVFSIVASAHGRSLLMSFGNSRTRNSIEHIMYSIPTLSYNPTGFLWFEDTHSTKERAYPRTDLVNFIPWHTFEAEIHQTITARMAAVNFQHLFDQIV